VMHRWSKLAAAEAVDEPQLNDDAAGCCDSTFVDASSLETELSRPARRDAEPRFVAHVSEYRANPVVSRRGYLYVTDGKEADESVLVKQWVVSIRYRYNSSSVWAAEASDPSLLSVQC